LSQTNTLDDEALDYLKKNGTTTVPALFEALRAKNSTVDSGLVTDSVWRLAERNLVEVEDVPPQVASLTEYLGLWERNVWFYATVTASLVTLPVIYLLPTSYPPVLVRWFLGGVFVLLLPGYATVQALFPQFREVSAIERLALSVGLSLALDPLVGLVLNYTPWGVELTPIVISLIIFTLGMAGVAVGRRYRVAKQARRNLRNTR